LRVSKNLLFPKIKPNYWSWSRASRKNYYKN